MNVLWPRFLKSAYRKEPISSFILIVGAVDAVIGGVGERWTLLSFGLTVVVLAAVVRWLQVQQAQKVAPEKAPVRYLPTASSQAPLPMLSHEKRRPPY
ncbi:MAG: hypothetical protein ACOC0N_05485 [Chroococcales cyanobacterium]